jgi:hypothetical protein
VGIAIAESMMRVTDGHLAQAKLPFWMPEMSSSIASSFLTDGEEHE